jgi:hypothetical protein
MKNFLFSLALVSTFSTSFYSPKSEATLLVGVADMYGLSGPFVGIVLCIVTLPLCFLNESGVNDVTRESLLDNGYGEGEVQKILDGKDTVNEFYQKKEKERLETIANGEQSDSQKTYVNKLDFLEEISSVPGVTLEYVKFVADNI